MSLPPPVRMPVRRWLKVPYSGKLEGIIAGEPVTTVIHWHEGTAVKCEAADCALCARQIGRQSRYTILLYAYGDLGLLEFTDVHYRELCDIEEKNGGCFVGARIEVRRVRPHRNARLFIRYLGVSSWAWPLSAAEVTNVMEGDTTCLRDIPLDPTVARISRTNEESRERGYESPA